MYVVHADCFAHAIREPRAKAHGLGRVIGARITHALCSGILSAERTHVEYARPDMYCSRLYIMCMCNLNARSRTGSCPSLCARVCVRAITILPSRTRTAAAHVCDSTLARMRARVCICAHTRAAHVLHTIWAKNIHHNISTRFHVG